MRRIFIFGDSIAFGRGVNKSDSWASKINDFFDANYSEENIVFNLGIPGETSVKLAIRLEREINARIGLKSAEDYNIIILATGINDSKLKLGKVQVSESDFVKSINEIINISEKYVDKIIAIGPIKVQRGESTDFKNNLIGKYNHLFKNVCFDKRIEFINLFESWPISNKYYCDDGVHPNKIGHNYAAEKIINCLSSIDQERINPFPILKNELGIDESNFKNFNLNRLDKTINNNLFLGNVRQEFVIPDVVLGGPCIRNDINIEGISLNTFYQIFLPIKIASLFKKPCKIYLGLKEELIFSLEKKAEYLLLANKLIKATKKIAFAYNIDVKIIDTSNENTNRIIEDCMQKSKLHLSKEESENLYSFCGNQNKRREHTPERILISQRVVACHSLLFLKKITEYNNFLIVEDFEQIKSYLYNTESSGKDKNYKSDFLAFLPLPNIFSSMTMFKSNPEEKIYLNLTTKEYKNIWQKSCPASRRTYSALLDLMGFKTNCFSNNYKNFISGMEYISNLFK